MGIHRRLLGRTGIALASAVAALASAGTAAAFQALPAGGQVNDDAAAGINPALSVSGEDPTNADVVGGALTAGKVAVPWAIFRQREAVGDHDQVFSRSFAAGAWATRGAGTVGGRSSASPTFSGSLNFDQGQDGETPAIEFAGAGRTVPWATWYENTANIGGATTFGTNNIFASRFDNTGDANQGKWIFAGQDRGDGGGTVPIPSLNIHTNQDAENPSIAAGNAGDAATATAPDPTKPGPWIAWQETSTQGTTQISNPNPDQIFVVRPQGPATANCNGVTPAQTPPVPNPVTAVGGFCWQQTGIDRFGSTTPKDPSLNVDPTRDGVEPDIAFTGAQDSVPWVVWYEEGTTSTTAPNLLGSNEMVFAAKGTGNAAADGAIQWTAVGSQGTGVLDATGTNSFGTCGASATNEQGCSLGKDPSDPNDDAEDPRVAAGTMNPANPTVPWVAWDEGPHNGIMQVFVSRLVGTGAAARFVLVNNGQPISAGANGATRPDITFSGNTPFVSWREDVGNGSEQAFVGHFVNAANPTFVLDESDVPLAANALGDVREPISSSCTANPFNQDGAACQGGAVGTPFFLFTSGATTLSLFGDAYQSSTPVTGAATGVTTSTATVAGSIDPNGARVDVSFQFGTTTAYGQSTTPQTLGPDNASDAFSAAIAGLAAGTTIHYRAVATSDFGTLFGADQTLTASSPAPPPPPAPTPGKASTGNPQVSGTAATVRVTCTGQTSCKVALKLTLKETLKGHKIIAISARSKRKAKITHKVVLLGTVSATITAGQHKNLRIGLNKTGRKLLASRHRLTALLTVTQTTSGHTRVLFTRKVTFKLAKRHGKGKGR